MKADEVPDGTILAVLRDAVGYQLALRTEGDREWLLSIIADQMATAMERLIVTCPDAGLQNDAQPLLDAYRYMRDECMTAIRSLPPPRLDDDHDHKGFSEEKCVRCGWVMGHPPLNCQNDNTPHVFPSQLRQLPRDGGGAHG